MFVDKLGIPAIDPVVALCAILIALLAAEVIWIIYARTVHPLAGIPGPWLASVSRLWIMYRAIAGDMEKAQRALHGKHGPLIRIAPNELACADPEAIRAIYRTTAPLSKTDLYPVFGNPKVAKYRDLFTELNEKVHSERRKIVSHVYSLSNVLQSEAAIDRVTTLAIEKLSQVAHDGRVFDLGSFIQWYTFDVIGELFYGRMFGFLEKCEDHESWIAALDNFMPASVLLAVSPSYARPLILLSALFDKKMRRAIQCTKVMEIAAEECVRTRQKEIDAGGKEFDDRDLLQQLIQIERTKGAKVDFTFRDVKQETYAALLAGSDTTAIAIRSVLYHLMKDQKAYKRLREEIETAVDEGRLSFPVKHAEAIRLPFLCACIKEGLRVHPSVAMTLPRLMPPGGMLLNGKYIPEGFRVGINAAVIHYDKTIFGADADHFRPDRWLDATTAANMEKYMFQFGYGTRTCIGKNISLAEIHKFVPTLLSKYDISLAAADSDWRLQNNFFHKQEGIHVQINLKK